LYVGMVLSPAKRREVLTEYEANGFRFPDSAPAQVIENRSERPSGHFGSYYDEAGLHLR
jgi:hypothetical protein